MLVALTVSVLVTGNAFLSVLFKLRPTSVYEYVELRFDSKVLRWLCSASYGLTVLVFLGTALNAPCDAIRTLTGLPAFSVILLAGIVGTFYTVMVR